ncbi:GAF domain-containing protein [Streptomyces sp. NPDC048623]|uniref:GAF domain-containing sensor histidine kinase n=1 Tax=Streptomyces sp. NPDC048623 TaxID=3155761 RepID=UPI003445BE59
MSSTEHGPRGTGWEASPLVALLDGRAAMREAAHQVRALTGADIALVGRMEDDDVAVVRSWAGTHRTGLHNLVIPKGLGLGGKVLATDRPCRVRDYARSRSITHDFDEPIQAEGIRAMLGVPIHHGGEVMGMVYAAFRDPGDFGGRTTAALAKIAEATAVSLAVADLAEAQREAETLAERRRIAVALHDSVGAMLFTLGAQVRDLRADDGTTASVADRLGDVERGLAEASTALRRSLAALSEVPSDRSLSAMVTADCAAFEERTGVTARAITLTPLPEVDPPRFRTLLTSIREALLNVEKHAHASSVVVTLTATDDGLTAVVADDGVGLAGAGTGTGTGTGAPGGGIGLSAVRERLERLGGNVQVVENDDAGLTVRIRIPLP